MIGSSLLGNDNLRVLAVIDRLAAAASPISSLTSCKCQTVSKPGCPITCQECLQVEGRVLHDGLLVGAVPK